MLLFVETCHLICVDSQKHKKFLSKIRLSSLLHRNQFIFQLRVYNLVKLAHFSLGVPIYRPIMMEEKEEISQQIIKKGILLKRQRGLGLHFWSSKKFQERYCILLKKSVCYYDGDKVIHLES